LAEGRWDTYVERAEDGARRRVRAHDVEQRRLLEAAPASDGPFSWWIPYATSDGYLALRTFHRPMHAEVASVLPHEGRLEVEGTLHGGVFGDDARLLGIARDAAAPEFETALTTTSERHFRAVLTSLPASEEADKVVWDLYVRPNRGDDPVRVGRIADDIVDRKKIHKYPKITLPVPSGHHVSVHPFFTVTNDLALKVT
jgi:hypothetical protein